MVKPVTSKRKLFNTIEDQKENKHDGHENIDSLSYAANKWCEEEPYNVNSSWKANSSLLSPIKSSQLNDTAENALQTNKTCRSNIQPNEKASNPVNRTSAGLGYENVRTSMPMSERQQIALLMQMSSPSPTGKLEENKVSGSPCTPNLGRGVNKKNERGETPLHLAAIRGDTEKVAHLITLDADVNAVDYAKYLNKIAPDTHTTPNCLLYQHYTCLHMPMCVDEPGPKGSISRMEWGRQQQQETLTSVV